MYQPQHTYFCITGVGAVERRKFYLELQEDADYNSLEKKKKKNKYKHTKGKKKIKKSNTNVKTLYCYHMPLAEWYQGC